MNEDTGSKKKFSIRKNTIDETSTKKEVFDIDDSSAYPKMNMSPIRIGSEELYGDLFTKFPIKDRTASGNFINKLDKVLHKYKLDKIVSCSFVSMNGFKKTKKKYKLDLVLNRSKNKNNDEIQLLIDIINSLDNIIRPMLKFIKISRRKVKNKTHLYIHIPRKYGKYTIIESMNRIMNIYEQITTSYHNTKKYVFAEDNNDTTKRIEVDNAITDLYVNSVYNISPRYINIPRKKIIHVKTNIKTISTNNIRPYVRFDYKGMVFIYTTKHITENKYLECAYTFNHTNELTSTYTIHPDKKYLHNISPF